MFHHEIILLVFVVALFSDNKRHLSGTPRTKLLPDQTRFRSCPLRPINPAEIILQTQVTSSQN